MIVWPRWCVYVGGSLEIGLAREVVEQFASEQ